MPIYDFDGTGYNTISKIWDHDGAANNQIAKVWDYDGTANNLIYSADLIIVGDGAETSDFISGGFSTWTGGWMNVCTTSQIQFCGGDGQQSSGGQSNNYLPTGYSNITIGWATWSDTEGYSGGVYLVGSDGSQITVTSSETYSLTNGVSYKIKFSAYHTYSRTVSVSISSIILSDQ